MSKTHKKQDTPAPIVEEVLEQPTSLTMDELTAQETFPKPDEEAIAAITEQREQVPAPEVADKFDPSIHSVGKDGKPSLTKLGKFRKKTGAKFKRPEDNPTPSKEVAPPVSSLQAAIITSGLIEQLSVKMISEDFIYDPMERDGNVKAWTDCYDYYGGVNISPPAALALNHAAIILSRAQKEKTKDKLAHIVTWFKNKFKRKPKNGTQPNSGNDGKRKDNVGAEESTQPPKS